MRCGNPPRTGHTPHGTLPVPFRSPRLSAIADDIPQDSIPLPRSEEFLGHPKGVFVCFFTEIWERFSFYGMKALLLLYLTKYHRFGDGSAWTYSAPMAGWSTACRSSAG